MRLAPAVVAAVLCAAVNAHAIVPPASPVAAKEYRHPDLFIAQKLEAIPDLPVARASVLERDARALGAAPDHAFLDPRAGRLTSLILAEPLIPGTGDGNDLEWDGVRPQGDNELQDEVWSRLLVYLDRHASILRVDARELGAPRFGVHEGGDLIQVHAQRQVDGVSVRRAGLTAVINHGNLVLLGLDNWGDATRATQAAVTVEAAQATVARHVAPFVVEGVRGGDLEYIPMDGGDRYVYRLVRVVRVTVRGDQGNWEGLVDAGTGALVAFEDTNQYAGRNVIGGVYPVAGDQRPPDGVEQPGWPMPHVNVTTPVGVRTTNAAGGFGCVTGTVSTALLGQYARIIDSCGAINESSAVGDLDLGFGPTGTATDCSVPTGHSPGDTKGARTVFYAATRINEQARGYLPANVWLRQPLVANVNMPNSCGAFWNGTSITHYRSSAQCRNTSESTGVTYHEWGHGLDNNGVVPTISSPGEAIADIHANLYMDQSCIGRGFFVNQTCGGYGDPCDGTVANGCTGVRDVDFMAHRCNQPHTVTWALSGFTSAQCGGTGPAPACPTGGGTPCGRETHCEGMIPAEVGFDVARRDLPAAGFDPHTSLELGRRLFFLGSQSITAWYTCAVGGGCNASGGYLQVLAADDDDGNIANGTPHMTAVRAAFARHEIHCATPTPLDSGCSGGPTTAPVLTATSAGSGVALGWTAVAGADRYAVFRGEGVNGAMFGNVKIAEVTGTSYVEPNLLAGRQYYFSVLPVGTNSACFGRMSNAASFVPVPGADLLVRTAFTYTRTGGDSDEFLDNCETANMTLTVENSGTGPLTNIRLVGVTFLTHPASLLTTTLPAPIAASLADCATADGTFSFVLAGATFGQATQIRVEVTADELVGQTRSQVLTIANLETDAVAVASRTYDFDADLNGWAVVSGTFNRQPGGAQGTPFHVSSSQNLNDQCDAIRSPSFRVKAGSALSVFNRFQIESDDPIGGPYDRANVGLRDLETNVRTVIVPSSGQLYTITSGGANGTCETTGQVGWNGASPGFPTFNASNWNAAAFNPGGALTNRLASIEIRYGTDPLLNPSGLDFDQVTLTDFDELVPDAMTDTCVAQAVEPLALAVDTAGNGVYQPNEAVVVSPTWRNVGFQAIAATGALGNHTGPAGPTYSIPDAAASYGTIAPGGNAACTAANNCYSVANTAATRPAVHWDSTAVETVTPTSTAKTWTLHVGGSFTDVQGGPFFRFVETLLHRGVTGGCTATTYCPSSSTTREQMAVFVLVAKDGPAYVPPPCVGGSETFFDVPASSPFCRWIAELHDRGIVTGCGAGNYCPTAPVTRDQMAVFVLRTLDATLFPPACVAGSEQFADVPSTSPFCKWIEELANRQVVTGCGGGNYCPTAAVTREQMGVFLSVTFGLTLYGL